MNVFGCKPAKPIIIIPDEVDAARDAQPRAYAPPDKVREPARELAREPDPELERKPLSRAQKLREARERRQALWEEERNRELARVAELIGVPEMAPVPARVVVKNDRNYDAMSPAERTTMFWDMINDLAWAAGPNPRLVQQKIRNWSFAQSVVFKEKYNEYYDQLNAILVADGMFERNGVNTLFDQAKVVSHAIALGKEQFETMSTELELFQFFVANGECQSLDAMLPDDMQH